MIVMSEKTAIFAVRDIQSRKVDFCHTADWVSLFLYYA